MEQNENEVPPRPKVGHPAHLFVKVLFLLALADYSGVNSSAGPNKGYQFICQGAGVLSPAQLSGWPIIHHLSDCRGRGGVK